MRGWVLLFLIVGAACLQRQQHSHPRSRNKETHVRSKGKIGHRMGLTHPRTELSMIVSSLVHLKQHASASKFMDLEVQLGSTQPYYENKMVKKIFDIVLQHQTKSVSTDLEELPVISFETLMSTTLWRRLPPISTTAVALEEFNQFAGGTDNPVISPQTLIDAYKQMLNTHLSREDAEKMLIGLAFNEKESSSVDRCEYLMGEELRSYLDRKEIASLGSVWNSRAEWKLRDVSLEMGWGVKDLIRDHVLEEVFFGPMRSDVRRNHKTGKDKTVPLTRCEFLQAIAWTRDSMLRSVFMDDLKQASDIPAGRDLEYFDGLEVYPHDDFDGIQSHLGFRRDLKRLVVACDDDGDSRLDESEFRAFLRTIDRWRSYAPHYSELTKKPVQELQSKKFLETEPGPTELKQFEEVWNNLAGPKSLYMTQGQVTDFFFNTFKRQGISLSQERIDKFRQNHQLAKFYDHAAPEDSNNHIFKQELLQAFFGNPQMIPLLSLEDLEKTLGLLASSEQFIAGVEGKAEVCDRDCWTLFSPITDAFNQLDVDSSGELSETEFNQLGRVVLRKFLKNRYPVVIDFSGKELSSLYDHLKKEFGLVHIVNGKEHRRFSLTPFANLFTADNQKRKITLESFLDPPILKGFRQQSGGVGEMPPSQPPSSPQTSKRSKPLDSART